MYLGDFGFLKIGQLAVVQCVVTPLFKSKKVVGRVTKMRAKLNNSCKNPGEVAATALVHALAFQNFQPYRCYWYLFSIISVLTKNSNY